ncbi:putative monovalent cation/H+ antiporter subunit A [Algoriphagus sp.]|uniref:putative monovalent cation/H+ antiporter subunit A n=1 Tax=Algoriphagus sp. TaxID=1872435 RepID=UPI002727FBA1|nr:putative monovalent cation/H+ antiporter subunit A [Algoriphagus sp.]MDO8967318.1 putative monovalent cation/H+ antiporter subunit A [Algoriphagus sp.]MDP3199582.1 putative monovalent cation/H+ antiporter subunit A [Algoriphagus sp.]
MLLAVLSGFIFALFLVPFGKVLKGKWSILLSVLPLALFIFFLQKIPQVIDRAILERNQWVPQLGINLDFNLDGLSLIFALMITGVGTMVFVYTSYYLKGHVYLDRFFGFLCLFMGAMLGLVLSENLITLFLFWELTSISSFFLIGFNNEDPASRKSALIALSVTGLGGLCLLAAGLVIHGITDSFSIVDMLQSSTLIQDHSFFMAVVFLIFGAAFTKSAQFPFHFWLPGAMKAPTPVSTYLHSATMVKAGIYLLFRLSPAFSGSEFWHYSLWCVGGATMVYAAFQTLFRDDLKSILAYSTVSALGILVFLIGLGTEEAMLAGLVFLLVHALYKATLFLMTGIIDHAAHTRNVSELSGLRKVMLPVAVAGFLAALSNAGIPPSFGFIGKDLIYEASMHTGIFPLISTVALVSTNVMLLFAGFLAGLRPFIGPLPTKYKDLQAGSPRLWVPTLILATLCLVIGLAPGLISNSLIAPALVALGIQDYALELKLWHGFNTVLALSATTIGLGLGLFFLLKPSLNREELMLKWEKYSPLAFFEGLGSLTFRFSSLWTGLVQNGYLRNYILVILLFLMALIGYGMWGNFHPNIDFSQLLELTLYETGIMAIMLSAIVFTVFTGSRLTAVAAMGVVGYSLCLLFVFYSAPDLAMTQFAIDTLTVILFVLVLYRLPKYLPFSDSRVRVRDGIVALGFGGMITLLALGVLSNPVVSEVSEYYSANAYKLAKGKNVVNVILVDFRGMDTLVEITVLVIAALGVFGLMKLRLKSRERIR